MKPYDLKAKRAAREVLQPELARALGISVSTLVDIELGRVDISHDQYLLMVGTVERLGRENNRVSAEDGVAA